MSGATPFAKQHTLFTPSLEQLAVWSQQLAAPEQRSPVATQPEDVPQLPLPSFAFEQHWWPVPSGSGLPSGTQQTPAPPSVTPASPVMQASVPLQQRLLAPQAAWFLTQGAPQWPLPSSCSEQHCAPVPPSLGSGLPSGTQQTRPPSPPSTVLGLQLSVALQHAQPPSVQVF